MTGFEIRFLADRPDLAPLLAQWHYAEWATQLPWWTHEEALRELANHRDREAIPTTLIACVGRELAGSASLVVEDLPEWRDFTPWMASVYVTPVWRGRGIATRLVDAIVAVARRLRVARLHLVTWDQAPFYARRGWAVMDEPSRRVDGATVMCRVP